MKIVNPQGYSMEEVNSILSYMAGAVKMVCGYASNAAWLVCLDALDKVKKHPNYKQNAKREFKRVLDEWKKYENRLLYPARGEARFFCLDDMTDEDRAKYREGCTDREYYDFWCAMGNKAYQDTKNGIISVLRHKYKKSLDYHNVPHSEILQYAHCAMACLVLSVRMYESILKQGMKQYNLPSAIIKKVFEVFNLERVCNAWYRAMCTLEPLTEGYELEEGESRNIDLGLRQLEEEWASPNMGYDSAIEIVKDYEEIFASSKVQKQEVKKIKKIMKS